MGTSLTYRLKRTGQINPPSTTPAHMPRQEAVAAWKDVFNVQTQKQDSMVFTRYEGKLQTVSLQTRSSINTVRCQGLASMDLYRGRVLWVV